MSGPLGVQERKLSAREQASEISSVEQHLWSSGNRGPEQRNMTADRFLIIIKIKAQVSRKQEKAKWFTLSVNVHILVDWLHEAK